jgi:hypothetical protein
MKRTETNVSSQLSKRDGLIRMAIQIVSRSLNPLFCLRADRRLRPTAQTSAIPYRLCQLWRIEKRHMVASWSARGTRGTAIDMGGGHRVDEPTIIATITIQYGLPRMVCIH